MQQRFRRAVWLGPVQVAAALLCFAEGCKPKAVTGDANAPSASDGGGHGVRSEGPWGILERRTVVLEPPEDYIVPDTCVPVSTPWLFPGFDLARLKNLVAASGLSQGDQQTLLGSATCGTSGCRVVPPPDFVLGMSPDVRRHLYRELGRFAPNYDQVNPFVRRSSEVDGWLGASHLAPETVAVIRKLLFTDGDLTFLADAPAVCRSVPPVERRRFISALARTRAQAVFLHVPENADVEALVRYWGKGDAQHVRNVRVVLTAAAHTPGGSTFSIFNVLPHLPRERLNTYAAASERDLNCYWATLNFFGNEPDARFIEVATAHAELVARYHEVGAGEAAFGDVVVFEDDAGAILHSAVYIADELVFTKNGKTPHKPFVLMRLDDLSNTYALTSRMRVLRSNGPGPA